MKRKRNAWAYSSLRCFFTKVFISYHNYLFIQLFFFYQGQSSYFPVKWSISSMLSSSFYISFTKWFLLSLSSLCVCGSLPLSLLTCFSTFFSYLSFSRNLAIFPYFNPTFSQLFFWSLIHQISAFFFFLLLLLLSILLWLNLLLFINFSSWILKLTYFPFCFAWFSKGEKYEFFPQCRTERQIFCNCSFDFVFSPRVCFALFWRHTLLFSILNNG